MRLSGTKTVAAKLGVTERRVRQLVDSGMPRRAPGRYDLKKCLLWYRRYLKRIAVARDDGRDPELQAARARILGLRAARVEFELQVEQGLFIPLDRFEWLLADRVGVTKSLLLNIPAQIAAEIERLPAKDIKAVLQKTFRDALKPVLSVPAELRAMQGQR